MCALTSYFAGVGCDEDGGCNEVVMEVAMEVAMDVVMSKEIKIKHYLLHTYYTLLYIRYFYFICTADGWMGAVAKSHSSCKQKCIKMTML